MAAADTVAVHWPKKFGKQTVEINAADFDPTIHERVEPEAVADEPPAKVHKAHETAHRR